MFKLISLLIQLSEDNILKQFPVWKLEDGEVPWLAQSHTASQWWGQDPIAGSLALSTFPLAITLHYLSQSQENTYSPVV